ncbi:MAG: C45 family peptidase [Pseudomonadota bacterium]
MSAPTTFPYYEVEGDAEAIGLAYGRKAMDRLGTSLEIYRSVLRDAGLSWDEALQAANRFISGLDRFDRDQATELRAIARGAGVRPQEVMIINARTDILYGAPQPPALLDDGCTGAIAMPEVTADGHLIHGQNWDWRADCKNSVVIVQRRPEVGPASLNLFEAGTLTRCGLNSDGIAMTANFLRCDHDPGQGGVPSPFLRRQALSASTFADAVERLMTGPRSFSNNIMLSDAIGVAINLETTPREYYWTKAEDGLLVHANHFTSVAGQARVFDTGLMLSADTLYREDRVRAALVAAHGAIDVTTMLDALADEFGAPYAVNSAPVARNSHGDDTATVASIVMDVTAREMTVVPTPYDPRSQAVTYQLEA